MLPYSLYRTVAYLLLVAAPVSWLLTACGAEDLIRQESSPIPSSVSSYYVSPNGNDAWSGSLESPNDTDSDGPFLTIGRARDQIRSRLQEPQTEDIIVYIRDGTYHLDEPLVFRETDSGQSGFQVIYRNYLDETPVISGGVTLTDWESYDENIYTTTVSHDFAALFENDLTGVLARHPNQDSEIINPGSNVYMKVAGLYEGHEYEGFYFDPSTFPVLSETDTLELRIWNGGHVGEHHWRSYLGPVRQLSYEDNILLAELDGITPDSYNALGPGTDYYIQNALELLDQPGEFYLEGTTLYYWPHQLPIEEQTIVAPALKTILTISGSSTVPAENIIFQGLVIQHTDREPYLWANSNSAAAIFLENAEKITIRGNRIHNIGGRGILGIGNNLDHITVESNLIYNIGDTAVQFNGWGESELNRHHSILNNHIHHIGLISPHALGLFLNVSSHNRVAHNLFHNIPNAAINISGRWSTDNHGSKGNLIEFNEFHTVTLDFQDMGLIYLGYAGPDNQIVNNYFHDSFIPFSFGGGIYMDEYADGTTIKKNLIEHLQQDGNGYLIGLIEAGDIETQVQNNIFTNNNVEMGGVIWPREYCSEGGGCPTADVTPPNDIDVMMNIFYNNNGPLYNLQFGHEGSWLRNVDNNLFFNDRDFYMVHGIPGVVTLDDWRDLPDRQYDANSLTVDPLFVGSENGDYRLRFDSPAYTIEFEDLNFADIGLQAKFPFDSPDDTLDRMFITSDVAGDSANIQLASGQGAELTITVRTISGYVADPDDYQVTCSSEDNAVATVDDTGSITAGHTGATLIRCSASQAGVTVSLPVYVLVDITQEEASQQIPPEIAPTEITPFLGVLDEIDFDASHGGFQSNPSHNSWRIVENGGGHIYCGYSDDVWASSIFGSVEWHDYQVEALISIKGDPDASGGLRTRNLVGRDWASYSHQMTAESGMQGLTQGYCGSDRCDIWRSTNAVINQGEWYVLRAEVEGNQVRTYLNGQLKVTQNLANRAYGNAGIFASPGTTVCVDNIVVRSLDRSRDAMDYAMRGIVAQDLRVHLGSGTDHGVVGNIPRGAEVILSEKSPDQTWVYIRQDSPGLQGWVPTDTLAIEEN